jgi:hypothetical protein
LINELDSNISFKALSNIETNNKLTTAILYKNYIEYIIRLNGKNRRLIEDIFYLKPQLLIFLKNYIYGLIKLVSILDQNTELSNIKNLETKNAEKTRIRVCDPIFTHLLNELKTNQINISNNKYYTEFIDRLEIWNPPAEFPLQNIQTLSHLLHLKGTNIKSVPKFVIPYLEIIPTSRSPEIILAMDPDNDIHNLDLLTESITCPDRFIGEINDIRDYDDIISGLNEILGQIITRNIRVPRHLIPSNISPLKIIVKPTTIIQPNPIRVLADLCQHFDTKLCMIYTVLPSRSINISCEELQNLAFEWELRIQKNIKMSIQIHLSTI